EVARERLLLGQDSATRVIPIPNSPPKPKPAKNLYAAKSQKPTDNAAIPVNIENIITVHEKTLTLPYTSAKIPKNIPPTTAPIMMIVDSAPPSTVFNDSTDITRSNVNHNTIKSNPSSIYPTPAAQRVCH